MRAWRMSSMQVSIPNEGSLNSVQGHGGSKRVGSYLTQLVHERFILDLESWVERRIVFSIGSLAEHVLARTEQCPKHAWTGKPTRHWRWWVTSNDTRYPPPSSSAGSFTVVRVTSIPISWSCSSVTRTGLTVNACQLTGMGRSKKALTHRPCLYDAKQRQCQRWDALIRYLAMES